MKYQNVNSESRILGCKRTFQKYGKSGIEVSDLFPHQAEIVDDLCVIRSMHGDMVVHSAAQYQMMTGPRDSGLSGDGQLGRLRAGVGSRVAAGLRGDARSARRAGGRPADVQERIPAGGLPAHDAAPGREAGAQSGPAEGRLAGGAAQDHRPDPLAERSQSAGRGSRVRRAHLGLRHGVQDADRGARSLRPQQGTEGDARPVRRRRPEDRRLRPALPAGAAHGREGRALRLRGLRRRRGRYRMGRAHRHRREPPQDGRA